MGRTHTLLDDRPILYVTRREHPGIPKGTEVTAMRKDGKLLMLHGDVQVVLDGAKYFLEEYEGVSLPAEFMLAH